MLAYNPRMTAWLATQLVAAALLPPLLLVILLAAGLIFHRRRPRLAMSLILLATTALYGLSTPWVGGLLLKSLEISAPVSPDTLRTADAIVVLGGGRRVDPAEYGGSDTLNGISLERLRYAAFLHRASGLPILATGGKPGGGRLAEGRIMQHVLHTEYALPTRWIEDASLTTWDNARLSAPPLKQAGVQRIVLVTHAWHLRRAVPLFEAQGLSVIPAGIQFSNTRIDSILDVLPTPAGLRDSTFALHEWLGILWYKLRSIFA
jgi:uncharacterized SAM-binding protein YcdF (DUF218 family)